MPIEDLIRHPARKALPAAGRNMVDELCMHFWDIECRTFPLDEDTVFGIVRAHRPTFRHHKAVALTVFRELRPLLEQAWRTRSARHATLREWTDRGNAARRKRKLIAMDAPSGGSIPH